MSPDHHLLNTRPFSNSQDLKALLHAPIQRFPIHIFPQHARPPIHENGVTITNFHFVPAVLGSHHVYIRTVSCSSEIATSFLTILRGYI